MVMATKELALMNSMNCAKNILLRGITVTNVDTFSKASERVRIHLKWPGDSIFCAVGKKCLIRDGETFYRLFLT
jgi:hypothetical protein